jgi:DNA polymerase III subunit delta
MIFKSYLLEQNLNLLNKNLNLFYGENIGLKNDFKKIIRQKFKSFTIIRYNQEEILKDEELFFNEINNKSLFNENKIYYIENTNDKILKLIQELNLTTDNQKLFLFAELLDKKSKIRNYFEKQKNTGLIPCYFDNELSIKKIIQERLKEFRGLSPSIINIIVESCKLDRVALNNELEKIETFFIDKNIKTEHLELLLDIKINDDFNLLKDEALNGNKTKTNKLLSNSNIEDEKNIFYVNLINQRLNKLKEILQEAKNKNVENVINTIKPPIFWKDKPNFLIQIRKWNLKKIKEILNVTYSLEVEIKSNSIIKKNILIKKLLLDICLLANA